MRKRGANWQLFILLVIASGTLIVGDYRSWWDGVRIKLENGVVNWRVDHTETSTEKTAGLEAKVSSLTEKNRSLEEENELLRKQLQAPLSAKFSFIPGYVISVTQTDEDTQMKVAAGSSEGVMQGMPVLSEAILIGIVRDVTPRISTVQLIVSPKSTVAVKTSGAANGIVSGGFVDRVLQSETLVPGHTVVTSGEDGLPPELLIGEIAEIVSETRDPFQKARIVHTIDPKLVKRVFIVRL